MNVETISVGEFQANCFAVWNTANQAIIIDPGADARLITSFLDDNNLDVASYMLTHGHVDHISAIAELYKSRPAPIGIHPEDLEWAFLPANEFAPFYSAPQRPPAIARKLTDHQLFNDGGIEYEIIHTPGHSPGSVCLYFQKHHVLFTGDTLFAGSIGRTDLPGGSMKLMNQSLKMLAKMPGETKVYTGHGPSTTMASEKKNNFYMMRQEIRDE